MLPSTLQCSLDAAHRCNPRTPATLCPHDGAPLLVRYPSTEMSPEDVARGPATMWRYRRLLPIAPGEEPVTLGEGATPLFRAPALERELRLDVPLYIKDESQNPTASFKARGMSCAVTCAQRLGAQALVAPSAGNAGAALAAYGARANIPVTVFLPRDTPPTLIEASRTYGAQVELVDGLIDEAGRRAAAHARETGAFNVATLREPYRTEGKKTMAYELVETLGAVPAAIIYPTGGGTGLIGMWKAFDELQAAGWIGDERPRMIAVQAEGCAPLVRAFEAGADCAERWDAARTAAWGLRVPATLGERLILHALRASHGAALAVDEEAMRAGMNALRSREGIDAGEEGGATLAALQALCDRRKRFSGPVVLFNTGSALTYGTRAA
ncbi:MAG: threonine synthase [Candidatus Eremiobacteraeota bacterium]|nr:threonine synthase [Candidatus Eremiobacteraeota bacterium]